MADGAEALPAPAEDRGKAPHLPPELGPTAEPIECAKGAKWYPPTGGEKTGLMVNNSLTTNSGGKKGVLVPFVSSEGKKVRWYTCGPTVYDSAHLGHARAYLTFDILRRIMEDYFGYEVVYHVNVTDVDDKIIMRARRNKLVSDFTAKLGRGGDKGYSAARDVVERAVEARRVKLEKKVATLTETVATLTAGATPDDKALAEAQTDLKEAALKLEQVAVTRGKVDAVDRAVKDGVDAVLGSMETEARDKLHMPTPPPAMAEWSLSRRLKAFAVHIASEDNGDDESKEEEAKAHAGSIVLLQQCAALAERVGPATGVETIAAAAADELGELLDNEEGSTVRDHAIFNEHARRFEREFMEDMELLGVRPPDVLTRVTEYIDEIVKFVKQIVDNGLAYESRGSVYLSIADFKKAGHYYRKLEPGVETTAKEMAEGEGGLAGDGAEKRYPSDFVLWKASKPGEPEWDSPWGKGRPGWHIECSAIASDILGPCMDIHAGGIDLKFPHHDNELAQSEACFGHCQWVSYFFHAGHLHIKGLKMSKSLKNFITIRQALETHTSPIDGTTTQTTARHIRLMFLMQAWDAPMNYSDREIANARKRERKFRNFFAAATEYLSQDWLGSGEELGWSEGDRELKALLSDTKAKVNGALCQNFNTKLALMALEALMTAVNKQLAAAEGNARGPAHMLVRSAAVFVTHILRVFGVVDGSDDIGFGAAAGGDAAAGDKNAVVGPYVDALVQFRDAVRSLARAKSDPKAFLEACDRLRDDVLVDLGVRLEDSTQDGVASRWRLDDPALLRQEQAEKIAAEREKKRGALQRKLTKKEGELVKAKASAVDPSNFFDDVKAQYTEFVDGVPTKDAEGEPLPKKRIKALTKAFNNHQKDHDKLIAAAKGDVPAHLAAIKVEIESLKAQLA